MAQTRTNADAILKDDYRDPARYILNNKTFLLSQVEKNEEMVDGRDVVLAINTGRVESVGARKENETLPEQGDEAWAEFRTPVRHLYGRIGITGPLMRSTRTKSGAFVRAVDRITKAVVESTKNDTNRQLYGTSTGAIVTLDAAAAGNVGTVTDPTPTKMRHLRTRMLIDIGTLANPIATATERRITSVDVAAGTFVFDGAPVAITAGDSVFRFGAGGQTADQREVTGLQTQVNETGTLFGVDPTSHPDWAAYVNDNGGTPRAVAEDMYLDAQQQVNIRSGEEMNLWITGEGVQRKTAALLQSVKRFPNTLTLKGGYKAIDMSVALQGDEGGNEVALRFDKDCPADKAFGLTTSKLQWYRMSDWDFMDEDGSVWHRVDGKDAYEATLYCDAELATDARNAHARIDDLIF